MTGASSGHALRDLVVRGKEARAMIVPVGTASNVIGSDRN